MVRFKNRYVLVNIVWTSQPVCHRQPTTWELGGFC
jgi:hypothetical protein